MAPIHERQTIMVVDDEPISLKFIVAMLEADGYETCTATDGQQCLDKVAQNEPDLIVMDIGMPVMDGIATCRQLKQIPGNESVPVVFVTAHTDDDTLEQAFEAGASDYVHKPVNRVELLARVRSALTQKEAIEKLAEKERLKAALETTGGVCHKLNQPLQYILGAIQILMMDLSPQDQMFTQLDKVREKVEQMGEITAKMVKITHYHTQTHAGGQPILDIDKCVEPPSDSEKGA